MNKDPIQSGGSILNTTRSAARSPWPTPTGRQVPTDHVGYVEDTIRVAEKPSMNRFTKIPIQARRGLPTRQVPTDHVSYVEDTIRIYGKPAMIRIIILKACRGLPAFTDSGTSSTVSISSAK